MSAKRWFVITIIGWTAFAVLITVWMDFRHALDGELRPARLSDFGETLVEMYTLGVLTPGLVYIAKAFPPGRHLTIVTIAVYVGSVIAAATIAMPLFLFVNDAFLGKHYVLKDALSEYVFDCLVYGVVLTIIVAVSQIRLASERAARAVRLEADVTKLRVEALQRQLHPHFIFNTLNALGAIMQTDVAAAEEMIAALAALLRMATDKSNRPMVPLREELNILDRYALIMKMRYGDRLTVTVSAEPRSLEVLVPTFTLQPLVENAIVHGLEKTAAGITIEVTCRLDGDAVCIEVNDNGATPDMLTLQEGVGIGNTRARLAELYGQQARLSIAPRESLGTRLTLAIPAAGPAL